MLNGLLDKAQTELGDTRHSESNAAHNFVMLRQSLEDQFAQLNKGLEKAKANEASLEAEKSSTALEVSQASSRSSCAQVAFDHVASVTAFGEELTAVADETQAARQERVLCCTRSARLAHFRNHDVSSEARSLSHWSQVSSRSCRRRPRLKRARRRS